MSYHSSLSSSPSPWKHVSERMKWMRKHQRQVLDLKMNSHLSTSHSDTSSLLFIYTHHTNWMKLYAYSSFQLSRMHSFNRRQWLRVHNYRRNWISGGSLEFQILIWLLLLSSLLQSDIYIFFLLVCSIKERNNFFNKSRPTFKLEVFALKKYLS